jgi:hypothetical protein
MGGRITPTGSTRPTPAEVAPVAVRRIEDWGLELVFDTLGRWGLGTTLAWDGRSQRR